MKRFGEGRPSPERNESHPNVLDVGPAEWHVIPGPNHGRTGKQRL